MRTLTTRRSTLILGFLGLVLGCGGDGGGGGDGGPGPSPTAARVAFTSQPAATPAGTALTPPITVVVQDAAGATVTSSSAPVTLGLGPGPTGATLGGTTTVNAVAGVATFADVSVGQAGAGYTLVASSGTLAPDTSAAFNVFGPAAEIGENAGDGQSAQVGTSVPIPPSVAVVDAAGVPVPGVPVTFAVGGGGGTVTPTAPVTTDANGIAAVTSWTLGDTPEENTLTATAEGLAGSPVTFTATATAVPSPPTTAQVQVGNFFFRSSHNGTQNPAVDTVAVNGTVTWTWGGGDHSVQSLGTPSFPSSPVKFTVGDTYQVTFTAPGTYQYDCGVHGTVMTGTVVVR